MSTLIKIFIGILVIIFIISVFVYTFDFRFIKKDNGIGGVGSGINSPSPFIRSGSNWIPRISTDNFFIGTSTGSNKLVIHNATTTTDADLIFTATTTSSSWYNWTMGIDISDGGKFKIASSTVLGTNDRFVIDGAGNIGIGTTSPQATLGISGSLGVNSSHLILSSGGKVGIGTTSPATALDVNGTITQLTVKSCTLGLTTDALGSITGCVASDIKLKTKINPFKISVLEIINKLNPVFYQFKDRLGINRAGFVAQDVEKVFSEAVVSSGEDIKGVDPNAINALLVKAIQEQQKEINELKNEIEILKSSRKSYWDWIRGK